MAFGIAKSQPHFAVQVLSPVNQAQFAIDELLSQAIKDIGSPKIRPSRMPQDVWAIAREYIEDGGVLDLTEDIAGFTVIEQAAREAEGNGGVSGLSKGESLRLRLTSIEKRTKAKETYLKVLEAKGRFITFDVFSLFLEDLFEILSTWIPDAVLLKRIGVELGQAAKRVEQRASVDLRN